MRWVPRGRRLWPPGPYLCPNSSRRGRPFSPPGRVEPRVTRIHPLLICTIGLVWLSCTCGAQGLFTHAQVVRSCLQIVKKSVGYRSNWSPVGAKRAVTESKSTQSLCNNHPLDYMPLMTLPVRARTLCTARTRQPCQSNGTYEEGVYSGYPRFHPARRCKRATPSTRIRAQIWPGRP